MNVQLLRRRFTAEEYHRMARAGVFSEDDRVELLEGEIVKMTPIGSRHAACVSRLTHLFTSTVGQRAIVWLQNPVRLGPDSEPQPDLALLRSRTDFYAPAHPGPDDVLLLIEVAETAEYDRTVKIPLYARAGIPTVWVVELSTEQIEVYTEPSPEGYRGVRRLQRGQVISLEAFPGVGVAVDTILGHLARPDHPAEGEAR